MPNEYSKINKAGPFNLTVSEGELPYIIHLLNHAMSSVKELPDFSEDDRLAIASDFGGEHKGAGFNTYSFLILAQNKIFPFKEEVERIRRKHGILDPYSEISFKKLDYGPRRRALPEFLNAVDTLIHGVLVNVAVERSIDTVFGPTKQAVHPFISEELSSRGFGRWNGLAGEKVLRICHSIAYFVALTSYSGQRLLWYCDNDAINENANGRSYTNTQELFANILGGYSKHQFELIGFAKSFAEKSYLDDLLSISDLAAGITQDILTSHRTGNPNIPGNEDKVPLLKWMANKSKHLSKITIQISMLPDGGVGSGIVNITPVD
ncbi:hypothetical protein F471_03755 [Pseudomonas sp. URMO17WK12:I1]|uniref:hypothetical protein n=1 Tax=unclassified Pseudomonas TaxID=196821 RepID=UPI0009DE11DB|nr:MULTISPECIES: hypothetical protein [unclassified Pseudomonas]PZW65277.1 hypothetical protein F471_03755 [Pseudomonas sp. URMO17WK12:I1]